MNEVANIERSLSFDQMKERASLLIKSGFLPASIKTPEQAMTIMMTGQELGLGFMESLRSINVVQGKPCMSAQLLLALCHRTKQVEQAFFEKETNEEAVFILKRKGSPAYKSSFSMEDARKLGLAEKDNYKKQPKTMLSWRAIAKAARVQFPDAVCGLYTPEEIADGVDLVEMPTGEMAIETVYARPAPEAEKKAAEIEQELPPIEGAQGLNNPMEIDRMGSYLLKPPYDIQFGGKCIMEIYGEKTPGGAPKGIPFLEMIAKFSKYPEEKAHIKKFLEAMKKEV